MRLSKYVFKTIHKNKLILYNSYNDSIVELGITDLFKKKTKTFLQENDFYDYNDKEKLEEFITENENNISEELSLTISFTENCNLACKYCSQNNMKNYDFINEEIIDEIVKYAQICIDKYKYKSLAIHLFGGEPLLSKYQIYLLKYKIEKLNVPVHYFTDTNATLLDEEFIKSFNDITITVTLSDKDDHDYYRTYKNDKGSYDDIIANLAKLKNCIDDKHRIIIRFNANHNNVKSFGNFVKTIKGLGYVNEIFIANTINFDYNKKFNLLSDKRYKKWYNKKAIPLLMKEGFIVEEPFKSYYCKGYERNSIKIYSNGNVSMCNAFDLNNTTGKLRDILNNYEKTKEINLPFAKQRIWNERITDKCIDCKDIFLCNGQYHCRKENYCNFSDYDVKTFLKHKSVDTK